MAKQTKTPARHAPLEGLDAPTGHRPDVVPRHPGPLADSAPDAPLGLLGEFEAMFEHAPVAMILVNRRRQVLRANEAARRFSTPQRTDWPDMPPGLFLCCPNHDDVPAGCGHGPSCPGCTLRQLIDRSFETRQTAPPLETLAPYAVGGRVEERRLRISTSHLTIPDGERTLLCIEDITERRLPPGPGAGELPDPE